MENEQKRNEQADVYMTFCRHGFQDGMKCPICKGVPQFSDNSATVTNVRPKTERVIAPFEDA